MSEEKPIEATESTKIICPRCDSGTMVHVWFDEEWQAQTLDAYSFYAHYDSYWCGLCEGYAEVSIDHSAICDKCHGSKIEIDEDGNELDCSECEGYGYDFEQVDPDIPYDDERAEEEKQNADVVQIRP